MFLPENGSPLAIAGNDGPFLEMAIIGYYWKWRTISRNSSPLAISGNNWLLLEIDIRNPNLLAISGGG